MVVTEQRQLSLFDADVVDVGPGDLEGLLAGPGQVVRLGGTARISVVVADQWRAHTLLAEYALRGVTGSNIREVPPVEPDGSDHGARDHEAVDQGALKQGAIDQQTVGRGASGQRAVDQGATDPEAPDEGRPGRTAPAEKTADRGAPDEVEAYPDLEPGGVVVGSGAVPDTAGTETAAVEGHLSVRTAFSACLAPIAARWLHGAVTRPPADFELNGPMLRLWYIAAGRALGPPGGPSQAVLLGLSGAGQGNDPVVWPVVVAALRRLGLRGTVLGPRGGGPAYRIMGRRRVARFAELIGTAPATAPRDAWPLVGAHRRRSVSFRASPGMPRTYDETATTARRRRPRDPAASSLARQMTPLVTDGATRTAGM